MRYKATTGQLRSISQFSNRDDNTTESINEKMSILDNIIGNTKHSVDIKKKFLGMVLVN